MNGITSQFLRNLVVDVVDESYDIDEITTTLATPGYQTPYAFAKNDFKKRNKKSLKSIGYTMVKEELDMNDIKLLKILIRDEIAEIFKTLYQKRGSWRK